MTNYVLDIECDDLIRYETGGFPKTIHCAVAIDAANPKNIVLFGSDEARKIRPDLLPLGKIKDLVEKANRIAGHNFINYDRPVIEKLLGITIPLDKVDDTMVMSKIRDPKRQGGHSLAAFGEFFGIKKPDHEDWSKFSNEMLHRCIEDVKINVKLYNWLRNEFKQIGFSNTSIRLEHLVCEMLRQQQETGFYLDVGKAKSILNEVVTKADSLKDSLVKAFGKMPDSRKTAIKVLNPKKNKNGEISSITKKALDRWGVDFPDLDFTTIWLFNWREFDPDSVQDRVRHLLRFGWKPLEFTEKGLPKFTEESLLNFNGPPEANLLKEYVILRSRQKVLENWISQVDKNGYVHSEQYHIGTWTHRCSHSNFMGNPPRLLVVDGKTKEKLDKVYSKYGNSVVQPYADSLKKLESDGFFEVYIKGYLGGFGYECRSVWTAPNIPGRRDVVMVGVDLTGIQMRAFGHYVGDPEYINKIVSTDIHTYHKDMAGFKDSKDISARDKAKRFIYAFLLGAGNYKVGVIYDPEESELEKALSELVDNPSVIPALENSLKSVNAPFTDKNRALALIGKKTKDRFIESIPGLMQYRSKANRGWFTAIDGRKIFVPDKHLHLACALQSFEQAIAKRAMLITRQKLKKEGIWYQSANFIHDEYQGYAEKECANFVGDTIISAIKESGEIYGSLAPLDGGKKIGYGWHETH